MRIETYNQVAQVYKANQTQKMDKAERVTRRDEVQISSLGADYQIAKQAMADIPDVRKDKIAAIKAGMEAVLTRWIAVTLQINCVRSIRIYLAINYTKA